MDPRASLCRQCHPCSGEDSPTWKGGRTRTSEGYIEIAKLGHPRTSKRGYVAEHTLVMERHLGRLLLPGETAHHKNGVRDDNRIENLELWVRTQPAGQRAEDLIAWAREILDRYA